HCPARPWPTHFACDAIVIESSRYLCFRPSLNHEHPVHFADGFDLMVWTGRENDSISLQALVFTEPELSFWIAMLIDKLAAESIARWSTLPETQRNEPALACKDFCGELATVLSSHCAFQALDDRSA